MGFVAAAWAAIGVVGQFVVRMVLSYAISSIMEKKKSSARMSLQGVMVNKNSNNQSIPLLYGKTRVGGVRAYINVSSGAGAEGSKFLNIVMTMCEGEIGDIKQLWFNDEVVWDADADGTIDGSGEMSGWTGDYTPALDLSYVGYHNGADNQTVDTVLQSSIKDDEWTANHRLQGIAYLAFKMKADPEIFKGGVPLITATVEGMKMQRVSDISQGATSIGTLYNGADVNPVDVLYDYMTNRRYGKGIDHDQNGNYSAGLDIDLESFKAARILAGPKFLFNGMMSTEQLIYNNIGEILENCNGVLAFRAGKYSLIIKNANEPTMMVVKPEHILTQVTVTMPEKSSKFNKITANYRNPTVGTDYNDDLVVVENSTYLTQDSGSILETTVDFDLINDPTLVTELATYIMDSSRTGMSITFEAAHVMLKVEAGSIIEMDLPNFGWTNKKFRVNGMELTGTNTIAVSAVEYIPSIELV